LGGNVGFFAVRNLLKCKKEMPKASLFYAETCYVLKLFSGRSSYGANTCASAAIDTSVSIDGVFAIVSSRNSAYGALTLTSTAADALITDSVSHLVTPPSTLGYQLLFTEEED